MSQASDVGFAGNECESTTDCIVGDVYKVCYTDAKGSDRNTSFCDCSAWYGFTGEKCDQPSVQTRYFTASLIIFLIYGCVMLVICITEIIRNFKLFKSAWNASRARQMGSRPNVSVGLIVLISNATGFASLIIYAAVNLRAMLNPSLFELETARVLLFNATADITVDHGNAAIIALLLVNAFFVIAAMQISLSWVGIATAVWKWLDEEKRRRAILFRRIMNALTIISLLTVIALISANILLGATIVIMLLAILLIILFIFGRMSFMKVANGLSTENNKDDVAEVIAIVKNSTLFHIILLPMVVLLLGVYYVLFLQIYELVPVGGINFILIIRDASVSLGLVLLTGDTLYVHRLFKRMSSSSSTFQRPMQPLQQAEKSLGSKGVKSKSSIVLKNATGSLTSPYNPTPENNFSDVSV